MTKQLVSENNIEYEINCADLGNALAMKNAVLKCIKNSDVQKEQIDSILLLYQTLKNKNGDGIVIEDITKALKQKNMHFETLLNGLKNAFIELDTSDEIYGIIWKCLSRCTYNGERIDIKTFEKDENRADFYEVVYACIIENIRPFLKSLISVLSKVVFQTN